MSKYRESVLTDGGLNLARQAENARIKITFTRAVLSAEDHTSDSMQALEQLTTLNLFVQSDPINYTNILNATDVAVPLRFSNVNQTTNNYINTIGLYATDGTTEVLHSVIVNDDPELFPVYNGSTPQYVKVNFETEVGRTSQINTNVSPMGMVTEEEFSAATKNWELSASHSSDVSSLSAEIGSVSSAVANNSGIASEFSSVSSGVSNNSSAITTLQTSVSTNSNNIGTLQTSVSNNANSIATNSNNINNLTNSISANSNSISAFSNNQSSFNNSVNANNSNTWVSLGSLTNSVSTNTNSISNLSNSVLKTIQATNGLDFWGLGPGIYQFTGQTILHNPYSNSSSIYGIGISYGNQIIYYDQGGSIWRLAPHSGSWLQDANESDLVNLQNQVNGVLARQHNLIQNLMNNAFEMPNTYTATPTYNLSNNVITLTGSSSNLNSFLAQSSIVHANGILVYAQSLGYSNINAQIINNSNVNITSGVNGNSFTISLYSNVDSPVSTNSIQIQLTFS